ncbi:uncharacterized protein LAESUDRAFT_808488 [Laetiporus sulphureus 93-53]|uniref:Uncharacterized protein n=1 Tax=Laetiporus sulphureus 93-53 TaxID=1314785 RepID=A0A165IFB8_9APHY|nr:uncharacterized protein LAESUDRAFT_808488 [Laetiporus sulphureus 93-53]KZT12996.1 hypothetical protein LAESUDRAFT_808488 [Laetiporus sulphureus 93-53]
MPAPLSTQTTNTKATPLAEPKPQLPSQKKQQQPPATRPLKAKKDAAQQTKASFKPAPASDSEILADSPPSLKKVARHTSRPTIVNWFQRKLAGTVRARRVSEPDSLHPPRVDACSPTLNEKSRRTFEPVPPALAARSRSNADSKYARGRRFYSATTVPNRKPLSFDGCHGQDNNTDSSAGSDSGRRSSVALESLWSPHSNYEADEDASVRPLPPSSPPSPSPSRSSSSYRSNPHTFRSMTASTKPTTLLSIDLNGGMAHIAQAPPTPTTPAYRLPHHLRTHSTGPGSGGNSITFSALPPSSSTATSSPSSGNNTNGSHQSFTLQAPQHTTHHPRNNPRPSSPPEDDASVLTLASSAFAMPGARIGTGRTSLGDDSNSHLSHAVGHGDSTSHLLLGEMDDERELEGERYLDRDDQDVDASVRALRPRSSRRCSWESEESKWSASASLALTGTTGITGLTSQSPMSHAGHRSMWTTGSYRTGGRSMEHGELSVDEECSDDIDGNGEETEGAEDESMAAHEGKLSVDLSASASSSVDLPSAAYHHMDHDLESASSADDSSTPPATPGSVLDADSVSMESPSTESQEPSKSAMATPKGGPVPLAEREPMPPLFLPEKIISTGEHEKREEHAYESDAHSITTTADYQTEAFHTPSTTPIPQ